MISLWPPVLGISGFSGSGKTSLIASLLPLLKNQKIRTAVIKHHGEEASLDRAGKDSDRFYNAGADVWFHDNRQVLYRGHSEHDLRFILRMIPKVYDLILVEGHKPAPIPKIWVGDESQAKDIPGEKIAFFHAPKDNPSDIFSILMDWLNRQWMTFSLSVAFWFSKNDEKPQENLWKNTIARFSRLFVSELPDFKISNFVIFHDKGLERDWIIGNQRIPAISLCEPELSLCEPELSNIPAIPLCEPELSKQCQTTPSKIGEADDLLCLRSRYVLALFAYRRQCRWLLVPFYTDWDRLDMKSLLSRCRPSQWYYGWEKEVSSRLFGNLNIPFGIIYPQIYAAQNRE